MRFNEIGHRDQPSEAVLFPKLLEVPAEFPGQPLEQTLAEVRLALQGTVGVDENGFYSRSIEIDTDTLRSVLAFLESAAES